MSGRVLDSIYGKGPAEAFGVGRLDFATMKQKAKKQMKATYLMGNGLKLVPFEPPKSCETCGHELPRRSTVEPSGEFFMAENLYSVPDTVSVGTVVLITRGDFNLFICVSTAHPDFWG